MEKMRLKIDKYAYHKLQPLGRPNPSRGVVSEDLGRTEFKISTTNGRRSSKHPQVNPHEPDESDANASRDDLDVLKDSSSPPRDYKKFKASKKSLSSESHVTSLHSRFKVELLPSFRSAESPDTKKKEANISLHKPLHTPDSNLASNSMPLPNQLTLQQSHKSHPSENGQTTSPLEELNPNRAKRIKKIKEKRESEPFPMQDDHRPTKSELKNRYPIRIRRSPAPFPMAITSPGRSPCKHSQPGLSETSSVKAQVPRNKENTFRVPQRFPLDSPPTFPLQCSLSDEDDEHDELALTDNDTDAIRSKRFAKNSNEQRANKRSRPSPEANAFDGFGSLSIEGDSHVDPESLCPYCDEPWPSSPSPTLLSLLERSKRKSYTDPRPGNALGLKAPLAAFIELCQRHQFEMTHLPLALERGWPTRLDFASLPNRIRSFEKQLRRLINHPNESQFWREVKDDVKEVGRMKVVSVSGQYATFERTQPGYYGEQGSIIIHQTLYSLFPPDDIPFTSVDPLTPDQFLTRVLVPETAALLIQADMCLPTKEEALSVLNQSKKYGVAMFPEQAQGEEAAEIGEQLARERAKERRKLLEERGEADADVQREVEQECRLAGKARGKHKNQPATKEKGKTKESHSDALSTLGAPSQVTPRTLKEQTRETSIISWRSKRSPSTSSGTRSPKPTSRPFSLYKSSRKTISSPLRPPTQENHQDSQWVFHLRNISPSPDYEDVDFDEIPVRYAGYSKTRMPANSDSNVVVMEDDLTPKLKPKLIQPRMVQRAVINDLEAATQQDMQKSKAPPKQKPEKRGDGLGQTKRKKKERARDKLATSGGSAHTWSLDDISE